MDLRLQFHHHMIQRRTSCVLISRGKSWFVDELHIPNAELRSSAELLSEHQKAEGGEPCLAQWKTGIHETGADTLSVSPSQASLLTKNQSCDRKEVESHSFQFIAWRSSVNSCVQNGYKIGASLRSRWKTTWRSDCLRRNEAGTAESVRKTGSKRFLRHGMASTFSSRKQQNEVRVLWGFQKFLGLFPSNSRTLWWNNSCAWVDGAHSDSLQLERASFSQELFFQHPIYPWERTHSRWTGKQGEMEYFS